MEGPTGTDADLVALARDGDGEAFDELFRRWFTPVWNVARGVLRDPDLAAEVTQDCFLVAWQSLGTLNDTGAFGCWMLRIARNRSLNRLGRERRAFALDDDALHRLRDGGTPGPIDPAAIGGPAEVAEIRDRQELVWAAAVALGERDWSLLDLHLRHGLTPAELAGELGVTANNAHQLLFRLRGKVGDAIGAYLLWRTTTIDCDELRRIVERHPAFDRAAWRAVSRHRSGCDGCADRHALLVRPEELLAGVPLVVPLPAVVDRVVGGLRAGAVPVTDPTNPGRGDASSPAEGSVPSPDPATTPVGPRSGPAPAPNLSPVGARLDGARAPSRPRDRRRHLAALLLVVAVVGSVGVLATLAPSAEQLSLRSAVTGTQVPDPVAPSPTTTGDGIGTVVGGDPARPGREAADDEPPAAGPDPAGDGLDEGPGSVDEPTGNDDASGDGATGDPAGEHGDPSPVDEDPVDEDPVGGSTAPSPPGAGVDPDAPAGSTLSVSVDVNGEGVACDRAGGVRWTFDWAVAGATDPVTSELVVATTDPQRFPADGDGSAAFCAPSGTSWTIEAASGAGTATRNGTLPGG